MAEQIFPYGHMLNEYYVAKAREVWQKRKAVLDNITTRKKALEYIASARRKLSLSFGPFPDKTALNPRKCGVLERKKYTIEKWIIDSRPDFPVTFNLYVPKKLKEKAPAVVGACGHSIDGKAEILYQSFCQGLVRQGYAVLLYDPISQGERKQYIGKRGTHIPRRLCPAHNMMGNQMQLTGDFFGKWRTWDGIRCLDYLLSRPEVDGSRVGVTGNSGGGTLTTYLNAFDNRFTMAAPSCFVTTYRNNIENEEPQDSEQIPPNLFKFGCEMADFFIVQAPRPTLLLGQQHDFFDPRGLKETFQEIRKIYSLLGAANNIQHFIGSHNHGYHSDNRMNMYRFFNKHAGVKGLRKEPVFHAEIEEDLWCTKKGQVHDLKCRKVYNFTAEKAREIYSGRSAATTADLPRIVRNILRVSSRIRAPYYRKIKPGWVTSDKRFKRMAVETEEHIRCPMYILTRDPEIHDFPHGLRHATLYVPHLRFQQDVEEKRIPAAPDPLFGFEPRGIGEATAVSCGMADFFAPYDSDYFHACIGTMLGESFLGRKVHDVLNAVALLGQQKYTNITLYGRGLGAIVCAFAGYLARDVSTVCLLNPLLSFYELTQQPAQLWPLSHLIPNVLAHLDLPDIYNAIGEHKKIALIQPWDFRMKPLSRTRIRKHAKAAGINLSRIRLTSSPQRQIISEGGRRY